MILESLKRKTIMPSTLTCLSLGGGPTTRRTEAILEKNGNEFVAIKGAVSIITPLCKIQSAELQSVENKMREFAEKGYRTIAVATNRRKSHMELVGIVALYDMPRQDSARLIEELRGLGISVKMLTGDSLPIAKEIARQSVRIFALN